MGFWDEVECINIYIEIFLWCFMGRRLLTVLVAAAIVLAGDNGIKNIRQRKCREREMYDAAYSRLMKSVDFNGNGIPEKEERGACYYFVTGEHYECGSPPMEFDDMERSLNEDGLYWIGRLNDFARRD